MMMALRNGQLLIKEPDSSQFAIIKSWGRMRWNKSEQMFQGASGQELLNLLASMVKLPAPIEAERQKINRMSVEIDRERMDSEPVPLIPPPVKVNLYKHQIRGYNMSLIALGLVDLTQKGTVHGA